MKNVILLFLSLALPVYSLAQRDKQQTTSFQPGVAVGVRAGTAGVGLDVSKSIASRWVLRVGGNLFSYMGKLKSGKDTDDIQIGFDYKIKLASFNALIDFYPFQRAGFRLIGGVFYNLNELTFDGLPTKEVSFNDVTFTRQQLGTINGKANFNKVAPYVGLGWGRPFRGSRLTFMADLGVFYQQSPQVTLVTTGMLEPSSDQGPVIEQNLRPLKYYPVLNLGLTYRL
ncbi:hypothetical protein ACFQ4C_20585 [Larkinella insperata]|uniref:Outer membrane protein beta-barrel domain-containing protein n=1 Tax=Larkinella insperata TaxID=332158 RepID=A0ABW3QKI0_9BACT